MSTGFDSLKAEVVQIPRLPVLYCEAGERLLTEILATANRSTTERVILLQTHDAIDDDKQRAQILVMGLLDEVRRQLVSIRRLLAAISALPKRILYVGSGHCLGSMWELALAAHARVWFGVDCQVGFPEIGSWCCPIGQRSALDDWWVDPVLSLQKAVDKELIHGRFASAARLDRALQWLAWQEERGLLPQLGSVTDSAEDIQAPVSFEEALKLEAQADAHRRLKPNDLGRSLWRYCRSSGCDGEVLGLRVARVLLGADRLGYHSEILTVPDSHSRKVSSSVVYIDVSEGLLPIYFVNHLIAKSARVVFFSEDYKNLESALRRIRVRFEAHASQASTKREFQHQVSWMVGRVNERNSIVSCGVNDRIALNAANCAANGYPVNGNRLDSKVGVLEFPVGSEDLPGPVRALARDLGVPFVVTLRGTGNESLVRGIRSVVLDELVYLARKGRGEIRRLLSLLSDQGWELIGEETFWIGFLQSHSGSSSGWLGFEPHDSEVAEVTTWKEILAMSEQVSEPRPESRVWLNTHFIALAAYIHSRIVSRNIVLDRDEAQLLVRGAIGLPDATPCLDAWVSSFGAWRFSEYKESSWGLNPDG